MIPYVHVPDLHLGPITVHPFGALVTIAVLLGIELASRRARRLGLEEQRFASFVRWMLGFGFVGGHVLDQIFYHPDEIVRHWWSLLMLWQGLSSFGGFTGALVGVLLWRQLELKPGVGLRLRDRPEPILPYCDVILAVFPVAWIFGRAGCATVHDHPGVLLREVHDPLAGMLAVGYPGPGEAVAPDAFTALQGHAPRFDLGLLEMLFAVVLSGLLALTWRRRLPTGTYVVVVSLAYAPVRFAMDFLRITVAEDPANADLRYGPSFLLLTPAQWESAALFVFGLVMAGYVGSLHRRGIEPMEHVRKAPTDPEGDTREAPSTGAEGRKAARAV